MCGWVGYQESKRHLVSMTGEGVIPLRKTQNTVIDKAVEIVRRSGFLVRLFPCMGRCGSHAEQGGAAGAAFSTCTWSAIFGENSIGLEHVPLFLAFDAIGLNYFTHFSSSI